MFLNTKAIMRCLLVCAGAITSMAPAYGQNAPVERSSQHEFRIRTLASGLAHPWGMAFLPDGGILISERAGRLRLFEGGRLDPKPISGLPEHIFVSGQGGLLDIALHPDFRENRYIYFSYAGRGEEGAGTEVARGRLNGYQLEEVEIIFRASPKTRGNAHYGGRLAFGADGALFISIGDRRNYSQNAQSTADHIGTTIRLNDDGSIPQDNPFVGQAGARVEIYSYGHRNPQGMALHPQTQALWQHEHGPRGGDEVNIIKPGANYGWPEVTYGIDYSGAIISDETQAPGVENPVTYWDPSIAPSGMAFYAGDKFPNWQGDLFAGALAHRHLRRLELEGDEVASQEILLQGLGERIRDVRAGPDGYLYVLTDSADGRLLRLEPVN